jgi:hypothetical protein
LIGLLRACKKHGHPRENGDPWIAAYAAMTIQKGQRSKAFVKKSFLFLQKY